MEQLPVIILCGGEGTRLREETEFKPKPMIQIGGRPMLVHIMKWYAKFGLNQFILALGYKQEMIKDYFMRYNEINNDLVIDTGTYKGHVTELCPQAKDNWRVTMADTGLHTLKGGRLKRIQKYIKSDTFFLTYSDGVGNVNIEALLEFHRSHGKTVTVTGVISPPRFGEIIYHKDTVKLFSEKSESDSRLINGGFFVFNKQIFDYVDDDHDLETSALEVLAKKEELMVYKHDGFWGCMDNMSDFGKLQNIWKDGNAPWKVD
jgi:glucose-1-phosphate cytidylyltransferase